MALGEVPYDRARGRASFPHGLLEKQRRHSYVSAKIQVPTLQGTQERSCCRPSGRCENLQTSARMQRATHHRLTNVWSKLQLVDLLDLEFDLSVVIDTDA